MQTSLLCQAVESVVPLRATPSERSEMVSQLLWGEYGWIEEQQPGWWRITTCGDHYQGWINPKMVELVEKPNLNDCVPRYCIGVPLAQAHPLHGTSSLWLPMGALLPNFDAERSCFIWHEESYTLLPRQILRQEESATAERIITSGKQLLNAPYLWGGRTVLGIDCSGLIQLLFSLYGISLPRDASQQARKAKLQTTAAGNTGDLLFFENESGKVIHVGIIAHSGQVLHASGRVRIDPFDQTGIYRSENNVYSHRFCGRILFSDLL